MPVDDPSKIRDRLLADARERILGWDRDGQRFVTFLDEGYPQQLATAFDNPLVLFYSGTLADDFTFVRLLYRVSVQVFGWLASPVTMRPGPGRCWSCGMRWRCCAARSVGRGCRGRLGRCCRCCPGCC